MGERNEITVLALILLLGLGLRLVGGMLFPLWSGPDEPAHFYYVKFLAQTGAMSGMPIEQVSNSVYGQMAFQPPLNHLLVVPVYNALAGFGESFVVHVLRSFNAFFGTACIVLTYLLARAMRFGKRTRIGSAAFIALLPTHVIVSATFNNDPLSWLFALGSVYFAVRAFESRKAGDVGFSGLLLGAGLLAKYTVLVAAVPFAIAGLLVLVNGKEMLWKRVSVLFVPLISLPVFVRNLLFYNEIAPIVPAKALRFSVEWAAYYLSHLFPGIWLQEYGTAAIPDYRIFFFAFYALVVLAAAIGFVSLMAGREWNLRRKSVVAAVLLLPVIANFAGITYVNLLANFADGRLMLPTIGFAVIMIFAGLQRAMEMAGKARHSAKAVWLVLFTLLLLDIIVLVNYNAVLPEVPWPVP